MSSPRSATTTRATWTRRASCSAREGVRRRRGQAAEARQPLALHAGDVQQAVRAREQLRRDLRRAPRGPRVRPRAVPASCRRYARELGLTFFATAFDHASADFLAELDMPAYKIASGDLEQHPAAQARRAPRQADDHQHRRRARWRTSQRAYDAIAPINTQLCILQCTAELPDASRGHEPAGHRDVPRASSPTSVVGLSDHDNGIAMAVVAYMLGARVHREALHAQPHVEGHGPRLLARADRDAARWSATCTAPASRSATASSACFDDRDAARLRRWARSSSPRATCPRAIVLARGGHRHQVARRRAAAVPSSTTCSAAGCGRPSSADENLGFEVLA